MWRDFLLTAFSLTLKRVFIAFSGLLVLLLLIPQVVVAEYSLETEVSKVIDISKLNQEREEINYALKELVKIINDSISEKGQVVLPANLTEFEKGLMLARQKQHLGDHILAIQLFKFLLEFEYYRTKGEELYMRMQLAASLEEIGASIIANSYLGNIYPDLIEEISGSGYKCLFLSRYATSLLKVDSLDKAKDIYREIFSICKKNNDSVGVFNNYNNFGFALYLAKEYDSAKYYFRKNQNPRWAHLNPVLYAFSFGNFGSILEEEGALDSAIFYLKKEVFLLKELQSNQGIENAYFSLGDSYRKMAELDSARKYYQLSLKVSRQKKNAEASVKAYEQLLELHAMSLNKPELQSLLQTFFLLNDSLKHAISKRTIEDEARISQFLKIMNDAKSSKSKYDELKAKNRELIYVVFMLGFFVTVFFLVGISKRKDRVRLASANHELHLRNLELEKSYSTISETNAKNEVLLKELHHRVKNNLQMIISLFNLQSNASKLDKASTEMFRDAQDRIFSIALVHKKIYQSKKVSRLNFKEYLEDFTQELLKVHEKETKVRIEMGTVELSIDAAVPLGLIFNELFTNSLKHALKEGETLQICIDHVKHGEENEFIYRDNGPGLAKEILEKQGNNSVGLMLIKLLSEQLEANSNFGEKQEGFLFSIRGRFK
jgi:two-component sensor histidine kinase